MFSKSIYHQPDIFYKGKIVHQSLKNGLGVSEIRLTQNSLFHFSFLNIEVFLFGEGGGGDVNPNFQHWGLFSYGGRQVYADVYR